MISNALIAVVIGTAYLGLFLLERAFALRRPKASLAPRLKVNIGVTILAFATAIALVQPAAHAMLGMVDARCFGLLSWIGLTGAGASIAAFLLLDLTFYYWHIANHRIALLWRFHNVHHIDPDLDVSTAFRFHFGEVAMSAAFRALQALVIGPTLIDYAIYETCYQVATLFHHSNLRLPITVERVLNLAFVTPRMHGIHHSDIRDEDVSNFGVIFSCWDRLHRSALLGVPQHAVTIGVPAYSRPADNRLAHALAVPFMTQRDYWRANGEVGRRDGGYRDRGRLAP